MGFEEYNATVLDHFLNPRHTGELKNATVVAEHRNDICGDHVKLSLLIEGGRVIDARTKTFGCAAAIACSSAMTELLVGRSVEEAQCLTNEEVVHHLGGLPPHKVKCSLTAEEVVQRAFEMLRVSSGDGSGL